jgi:NADH-quinone oxidoreductase subunit B
MECLLLLQDKVGTERRPLSWWMGPQEVREPIMPSRRDCKREERSRATVYPPTDRLPITDLLWRRPGERRPGERSRRDEGGRDDRPAGR